jgi:nitroreductase
MEAKNTERPEALDLLRNRRSILARYLGQPAPDTRTLRDILNIALRVPDHRKLEPWRFIVIQGQARERLGEKLAEIRKAAGETNPALLAMEKQRFSRAPLVVTLVFSPTDDGKTPEFEQLLSAGAVGQNLHLATAAHGYASQWLTDWPAYDPQVAAELGLAAHERIAGFFHIGTATQSPKERPRPDLESKITEYSG